MGRPRRRWSCAGRRPATIPSGQLVGWLPDDRHLALAPTGIPPAANPATDSAITSLDTADLTTIASIWPLPADPNGSNDPCGPATYAAAVSPSGEIAVATGGCGEPVESSVALHPPVVHFVGDGKIVSQVMLADEQAWRPYDVQFTADADDVVVLLSHQDCMTGPGDVLHVHGQAVTKLPTSELCG